MKLSDSGETSDDFQVRRRRLGVLASRRARSIVLITHAEGASSEEIAEAVTEAALYIPEAEVEAFIQAVRVAADWINDGRGE